MIGRRRWMGGAAAVLSGWGAGTARARAEDGFVGLPSAVARIEAARGGRLGVAVLDAGSRRQAGYRQDERFPLGSTYKLLAAGAVLLLGIGWYAAITPAMDKAFVPYSGTALPADPLPSREELFVYRLRVDVFTDPALKATFRTRLGMPACP